MLTATKQSTTGYWIEPIRKNVYSLEEINYYIYNHIDLIYRDFFSEELFQYVETELENPDLAAQLRQVDAQGGGIGDFIRCILNGSFYYNARELANISLLVANIDSMGKSERIKIQADAFMRSGSYNSALHGYLEILKNKDQEQMSNTFYAAVAFSVGTIYARLFMSKSANTYFTYAYDLSPDPQYARACVYMSILTGDDEELLSSIVKFKITDDELDSMRTRVLSIRRELESSEELRIWTEQMENQDFLNQMEEQWRNDYYKMLK